MSLLRRRSRRASARLDLDSAPTLQAGVEVSASPDLQPASCSPSNLPAALPQRSRRTLLNSRSCRHLPDSTLLVCLTRSASATCPR